MKKTMLAFFLIITLLLAAPAYAEIYKYVDENGQNRWTDDLSQVPQAQRSTAQRFESEADAAADTASDPAQETQPESPVAIESALPDADQQGDGTEVNRELLEKEKAELDTQYQLLLEERNQLEQLSAEVLNSGARAEINLRISEYNAKTKTYEAQLNAFNEKIEAYNQSVMSKQSP